MEWVAQIRPSNYSNVSSSGMWLKDVHPSPLRFVVSSSKNEENLLQDRSWFSKMECVTTSVHKHRE